MAQLPSVGLPKIIAQCACGQLVVELDGLSEERYLCCCSDCQSRTGSPLSVSWYYPPEKARHVKGEFGTFKRTGTKGTNYSFHFCSLCGSNVFWHVEQSGFVGVAAGCIPADFHMAPVKAVWVGSRPDWVVLPTDIPWHEQGTSSAIVKMPD